MKKGPPIRVSMTHLGDRPGYVALWYDPKTGKKICRGLKTTDEVRADTIRAEIQRVLNTPGLLDPNAPDHDVTDEQAYRAIFQRERRRRRGLVTTEMSGSLFSGNPSDQSVVEVQFRSERLEAAEHETAYWKKRAQVAEGNLEASQAENLRLSKSLNRHCKVTLGEALRDFSAAKRNVTPDSMQRYEDAVEDFILFLGARKLDLDVAGVQRNPKGSPAQRARSRGELFRVADIRGKDIDDFFAARLDKRSLRPITEKRKLALRRELSAPYHFWLRRYELTFNAFAHVQPGASQRTVAPAAREMIRRVEDLQRLLWAMEKENEHALGWRAFVATAALTGADLGDLFDLAPADVVLEEPARLIMCRNKTGQQRDTPLERTILLPILNQYLRSIKPGQKFLFPTLLPEGTRPRSTTEPEKWSGASAFHQAWKRIAERCVERISKQFKLPAQDCAYCLLGPRAWRRSAVTFMHGAGALPGQVARWVGHSVQIEDRHYLGQVERNGLVFESGKQPMNIPPAIPLKTVERVKKADRPRRSS